MFAVRGELVTGRHPRRRLSGHALPRAAGGATQCLLPPAATVLPLRAGDAGDTDYGSAGRAGADAPARDRRDRARRRAGERGPVRDVPRWAAGAAATERAAARRLRG